MLIVVGVKGGSIDARQHSQQTVVLSLVELLVDSVWALINVPMYNLIADN